MTTAEINALERVWVAEICNSLPYQSKAKLYAKLAEDGLLEPMERMYGIGTFVVKVEGWALTHAGRLAYCATC